MATVVSAVIAGIFSLIGIVLNNRLKTGPVLTTNDTVTRTVSSSSHPSGTVAQTVVTTSQSVERFSYGKVLIHIGVLQLVLNLAGFVLGLILGSSGISDVNSFLMIVLFFGTLVLTIGFVVAGGRVSKEFRWKHLFYVSIGIIITTLLINSLVLQAAVTGAAIVVACIQTFLAMGIGGAIANAMK